VIISSRIRQLLSERQQDGAVETALTGANMAGRPCGHRGLDDLWAAAYVADNGTGNGIIGLSYCAERGFGAERGSAMLQGVAREEATSYSLPGRDWYLCIGPQNSAARNLTVGLAVFPEGSAPDGHVHDTQEEVIHVVSGRGRLVTPDGTVELLPGTSAYIPAGLHHATVSSGPGPLELLCAFSPPVVPGSYEVASSDRA